MNEIVETKAPQLPSAMKHGILSKHLLLQSEEPSEFIALLEALRHEYLPESVTEQHLVEELAGIIWRKRRLKIAEAAHHRKELRKGSADTFNKTAHSAMIYTNSEAKIGEFNVKKAIASTDAENENDLKEIAEFREPTIKALALLEDKGAPYEKVLAALPDVTREWWQEEKLGEKILNNVICQPSVEHLQHFLRFEALSYYNQQYEEVCHRTLVREQAEGEAFIPDDKMEKFSRYEVHLDRKFERTLTVLLRLQEMKGKEKQLPHSEVA